MKTKIARIISRAADRWDTALGGLTLNDLSAAWIEIEQFDLICEQLDLAIGQALAIAQDIMDPDEHYEIGDIMDDAIHEAREAYEDARHDLVVMIDDGWADPGFEIQVQEEMENSIAPRLFDGWQILIDAMGEM